MLRWLLRRMVERFERNWHYDASYLKDIMEVCPRASLAHDPAADRHRREIVERCGPRAVER